MKPSSVCIPVCALSRLGTQIALQSWAPLKKEVNDIWKNSTGDLAEALQSEESNLEANIAFGMVFQRS